MISLRIKRAWEVDDTHMFGMDFCVAPVMEEDVYERSVYLPLGCSWKDVFSGICYEGGQTVTVDAPMDKIPVFVKAGSKWEIKCKVNRNCKGTGQLL